jgi:hypothetical protein
MYFKQEYLNICDIEFDGKPFGFEESYDWASNKERKSKRGEAWVVFDISA